MFKMKMLTVVLNNKSGLHARPASLLVKTANKYKSNITIKKDNKPVNGKSIMGILGMAASEGDEIEIIAEGYDEVEAINEMKVLFNSTLIHE